MLTKFKGEMERTNYANTIVIYKKRNLFTTYKKTLNTKFKSMEKLEIPFFLNIHSI